MLIYASMKALSAYIFNAKIYYMYDPIVCIAQMFHILSVGHTQGSTIVIV